MNSHEDKNTHIVIVGAGYAGVLAANRAAAKGHQVTLVNDRDSFVDRIRLHEVIARIRTPEAAQIPLEKAVRPRVRLVIAPAARIRSRTVELATGETVRGDHIVVATGSGAGPGGLEWAEKNHAAVAGLPPGASVAVAGAGLTGVEVASEIAYARPDLRLTLADPSRSAPATPIQGGGTSSQHWSGSVSGSASQTPDDTDLVVDCTGFATPPLAGAR